MIRISKLADYAVVVLAELARGHNGKLAILSATALAAATQLPETTVAKVLKTLAAQNILSATRGAGGGYELTRPTNAITMLDIIEAMDGTVGVVDCTVEERTDCLLSENCKMKSNWSLVNNRVRNSLAEVTLYDMLQDTCYAKMSGVA
jgi:FeS assembly SUF system regulator